MVLETLLNVNVVCGQEMLNHAYSVSFMCKILSLRCDAEINIGLYGYTKHIPEVSNQSDQCFNSLK